MNRKKALPIASCLLAFSMVFAFSACSDDESSNPNSSEYSQDDESSDSKSSSSAKSSSAKSKSSSSVKKSSVSTAKSSDSKKSSSSTAKSSDSQKSSSSTAKSSNSGKSVSSSSEALKKSSTSSKTSSSATAKSSASVAKSSSSAAKPSSSNATSSSAKKVSSSSAKAVSSSSVKATSSAFDLSAIGTCAPANAVAEMGEKVTWKFTRGEAITVTDLLKGSFKWTFEGGSAPTVNGDVGDLVQTITYAASGDFGATFEMDIDGISYSIPCTPVHINGASITDCRCNVDALSVDYKKTPSVEWTVFNCTTEGGKLTYVWEGKSGTDTFSKAFDAPHSGYSPTLIVQNEENTKVEVLCPAVKVTDGPEFTIAEPGGSGTVKLPAGASRVTLEFNSFGSACAVFCQVDRQDSPSGDLDGTVNGVALRGRDYVSEHLPSGSCGPGAVLEFVLDVPATCGAY